MGAHSLGLGCLLGVRCASPASAYGRRACRRVETLLPISAGMNRDPHSDALEAWIDRELRKLPLVEAPPTLAPRVLAAVRARQALPWWRQPLWFWPAPARAGFLILALLVAVAICGGGWWVENGVRAYAGQAGEHVGRLTGWTNWGESLAGLFQGLWAHLHDPWVLAALGVCLGAYFLCLGLGTTLLHVALRRRTSV